MMRKFITLIILAAFLTNIFVPPSCAQGLLGKAGIIPEPGTMVGLSQASMPPVLRGMKVFAQDPFKFDFILDPGDQAKNVLANGAIDPRSRTALNEVSKRLIKYFLTAVTVPEDDIWVNLSPYEKDHITAEKFGQTEMGRDLLNQDYLLKQITASLLYPEGQAGKKFWARVYEAAQKKFGTTQIPTDMFNKVWIMPDKAVVYEKGSAAFVVEAKLKVMLESDYLAMENNVVGAQHAVPVRDTSMTNEIAKDIAREVIIPILEKEVNEGENFASLRQVYTSIILALWYKEKVKDSMMSAYVDHNKVAGVDVADKEIKQRIWQQYVEAFKKGAVNLIKEERDTATGEMMERKYFAGGFSLKNMRGVTKYITALPKAFVLAGFLLVSAGCGGGGGGSSSSGTVDPGDLTPEQIAKKVNDSLTALKGVTNPNDARSSAHYKAVLALGERATPALIAFAEKERQTALMDSVKWALLLLGDIGGPYDSTYGFLLSIIRTIDSFAWNPYQTIEAGNALVDLMVRRSKVVPSVDESWQQSLADAIAVFEDQVKHLPYGLPEVVNSLYANIAAIKKFVVIPADLSGPVIQGLQDLGVEEQVQYSRYMSVANPQTNIQLSYEGVSPDASDVVRSGVATYDLGLKGMAALLGMDARAVAENIIGTYIPNNHNNPTEITPITYNLLTGGVNNFLRIDNFSVPNWWEGFEWTTIVGPNAWIGAAGIRLFELTSDQKYLDFSTERLAFLFRMMDTDGGLRMGPENGAFGSVYWNKKSIENVFSSHQFLNDFIRVLSNKGISAVTMNDRDYTLDDLRQEAGRMYEWMKGMFDRNAGVFHRGQQFDGPSAQWRPEPVDGVDGKFATDSTSWAPIEMMLEDAFFGATVNDRINLIDRMFQQTENFSGVFNADGFIQGFDFSRMRAASDRVIWIEGSAQMPYLLFAIKCSENGRMELAEKYFLRYMSLVHGLSKYRQQLADGRQGFPYAVSRDGAVVVVDTGHDWTTPEAKTSLSSTIYYAALTEAFDPFRGKDLRMEREALIKKLLSSFSAVRINTALERIKASFGVSSVKAGKDPAMKDGNKGGIDLQEGKIDLERQGAGKSFRFNVAPDVFKELERSPGLTPFIIQVTPMNDLQAFLG